jgi:hypothetical protein
MSKYRDPTNIPLRLINDAKTKAPALPKPNQIAATSNFVQPA